MKKFFSAILVFALMLFAIPTITYAADGFVDANSPYFEGETDVSYRIYSSYYVSIPTSIDSSYGTGEISVTMDNIEDGYHIKVSITNLNESGKLAITSETGNTAYLNVLRDSGLYNVYSDGIVTNFYPADYPNGGTATTNISFDTGGEYFKPGTYHGTICFRVECIPDSTN